MPSKVDIMLANLEAEQLLDTKSQQEEMIRAKDVAKRQATIEEKGNKSNTWKNLKEKLRKPRTRRANRSLWETLEKRRGEMQSRWEKLEARRRARMQYYHAKIHHERSLNIANSNTNNDDNDETTDSGQNND